MKHSDQGCKILPYLSPSAFLVRNISRKFQYYVYVYFTMKELFKINQISFKIQKYVFFLFIIVLTIGLVESLFLSPKDYQQSDSVRIMYVHVPSAWTSLGIFSVIAILSLGNLVFKNKYFSTIAKSLAPSGLIFSIIALVTGAIWGKPTWGTWWVWDARITSMLVLCVFYILYIMSWRIFDNKNNVSKITSLISILGLINLPIIKFSVDWWTTLHQPASIGISGSSIHSSMLLPLFIMTAAFVLFSILIFLMKYNTELIKIKNKGLDRI